MKIICTCCGGSGQYSPLFGPPEPCGTCKGEKYIAEPKKDEGPVKWTPQERSAALSGRQMGQNGNFMAQYATADNEATRSWYKANLGEAHKPENRIHRVGHACGDVNINFSIPNGNDHKQTCEALDTLIRGFYRQLQDLGVKVESTTASVGPDKMVLSEDKGVTTTWHHKSQYTATPIVDEFSDVDFAAINKKIMQKNNILNSIMEKRYDHSD